MIIMRGLIMRVVIIVKIRRVMSKMMMMIIITRGLIIVQRFTEILRWDQSSCC